jgi:hypothetical protein
MAPQDDWKNLPVAGGSASPAADTPSGVPAAAKDDLDWKSLPTARSTSVATEKPSWMSLPTTGAVEQPAAMTAAAPVVSGTSDWMSLPVAGLGTHDTTDKYSNSATTRGLTSEERAYGQTNPEKMDDEPWYSKAWEWMNSPLYDLHKWGTREGAGSFERGLETGLEDIGSSFTSPLMIGLTIASFGGSTVEGAGIGILKSIGVNEYAAPIVARTAKGLLTAGFTTQMLGGLMTQSPQFLDALKDGDVENATRLGTNILASVAFIQEGMKHGLEDVKAVKSYINGKDLTTNERLKLVQEAAGLHDEEVQMGSDAARARQEEILRLLKASGGDDPIREAGIRHWVTQDGDAARIAKMKGIAEGTLKARALTPEEQANEDAGTELRQWASKSLYKDEHGKPVELYVSDAVPGTHKLGQTLSATGEAGDQQYVRIENPINMRGEAGLTQYIQQIGEQEGILEKKGEGVAEPTKEAWADAQEAMRKKLKDSGYDGITFKAKDGAQKVIALENDQYRPVADYEKAANTTWNREHAYVAVDKKNMQQIRTSGIGVSTEKNNIQYFATPDEALKKATLPDSGNRKDLTVLAVPRAEIEADVRESNAKTMGKTPRGAAGPVEVYPGVELRSETKGLNKGAAEGRSYEVGLHNIKNDRVGRFLVNVDAEDVAHMNISGVESDLKSGEKSSYRGRGYAKAAYIEAMRIAKEHGLHKFTSDENGATSLDARHVWESLDKEFDVEHHNPTGEKDFLGPQYSIDLDKIPIEKLAPRALRPGPVPDDMLVASKRHMPGHILERDEEGNLTSHSTPLRPIGAEDLPGDNSRFNSQLTPKQRDQYLAGLDYAINRMTEEDKSMAKMLRQLYDNSFQKAYENGLIHQWVEAYHPQAWAGEDNSMWNKVFGKAPEKVTNQALNRLRYDADAGHFSTNINQAKYRVYNTEFEGVMAGEVFKHDDLAKHAYDHMVGIDRAIAGRKFLEALRTKGAKGPDGRPAAVLAGTARVMGAETNNPAVALDPKSVKTINISPEIVEKMREGINPKTGTNDLQDGLNKGIIYKLPWTIENEEGEKIPAYAYSSDGYVKIDSQHTRAWGYAGQDTAGNPAIMRGDLLVHPDYEKFVRQVIDADRSVVRNSPTLSAANRAAGEAKGLLLSISPFHLVQESLRAMMVGINPLDKSHLDINDPAISESLRRGVRQGLIRNDYKAQDKFSTGMASHSSIINAIPGLKQFQGKLQSFLFNDYIPSLKDRAYLKIFDDMRNDHPHLTADEAASRAADTVNDVFGGQNWRKLGWSASQQDFARMIALAPDWLLSEMRMGARALGLMDKETGAYSRKIMVKQLAAIWLGARVINMLTSGQMHNEAPFGVASKDEKGNEKIYSIRTLPTDLIHAMSSPREFLFGRVNPLTVRPVVEGLTGRDPMGRRAPFDQQASDLVRNIIPIVGQGIIKGGDVSAFDQVYKGMGATVRRYKTEAEKLAEQYASDRMPTGPVDPEHLKAHQQDIRLEDAYRAGKIGKGEIMQHVSKRRADEIIRRAPLSPLQARFDRLPLSEAINVWDAAGKSEKDQLSNMLWKKRVEYMKQHTAAQRADDPTWRKLQSVYGDLR